MAQVILGNSKNAVDKAVAQKVLAFLIKLQLDDTAPGLHIEPMHQPADPRVRTARVDQALRAILFKLAGAAEAVYVYVGTWPHDEAIALAKTMVLKQNPLNGVPEIAHVEPTTEPARQPASAPVAPATPPLLATCGFTLEDLTATVGIADQTARAAMAAATEADLVDVAARAVEWQGLALLDLATGRSIDDVRDMYSLGSPPDSAGESEDDRLIDSFQHPAARAAFVFVDDDEELRRAIEGGNFDAWRTFLHPEQRKYATATFSGPFRLSGGAGTGKTVVLLHRARELARANPDARIVLTTFTKNLAEMLRANLKQLDPSVRFAESLGAPGVFVSGIDSMAAQILKTAGADIASAVEVVLGEAGTHVQGRTEPWAWTEAISMAAAELPEGLKNAAFFDSEYTAVVLPARLTSRTKYNLVRRPGRGVALDRALRSKVWDVIDTYRAQARISGTINYEEAVAIAAVRLELVAAAGGGFLADHVLVDEGQDLGPSRWRLLRALAAEGVNDLFIAEDSYQRIYGRPIVLRRSGINIVGRSRRLTLNYRTTAQNLGFAVSVLEGASFHNLEEAAEDRSGYHSARLGPTPRIIPCSGLGEELDRAAEVIKAWTADAAVEPETVAILVRDMRQRSTVVTGLSERGVTVRPVDNEKIKPGLPVAMTMHRAKGTEFTNVLLFGINEGSIPAALAAERYSDESWADAMLRERSLLYVAATRARDELVVMWSGDVSPLLG
jgi:hypothetical protein